MKKITLAGITFVLLCLLVVSSLAATPVNSADAAKKTNISFEKIGPSNSNDRFQSYFQTTPMTRTFTADDNGKTFTLSKWQVVMVKLGTNPSTGFQWVYTVSPGISILGDSYQSSVNNRFATGQPVMVGAGGVRTWTLKMTSTGDQQFSAEYKQIWMPEGGKSYTLHFIVV
jgi:predicted secreted protein